MLHRGMLGRLPGRKSDTGIHYHRICKVMKKHTTPIERLTALIICVITGLLCYYPEIGFTQQPLSLKDALQLSVNNYGTVLAKTKYAEASKKAVKKAQLDYLPNFNFSAEINYGTANGQNGPSYTFIPPGIASGGIPLASQNWNATFGSLFFTNINWDFFAFGRSKQNVQTARTIATRDVKDVQQEVFQLQVKVAASYLNLLAAQRLAASYQKNLDRADTLRKIIVIKAKNDLAAGVDSSQANAEVSSAKVILLKAMDAVDEENKKLIDYLGAEPRNILTDTLFIANLPSKITGNTDSVSSSHPVIDYYNNRVLASEQQARYYRTLSYPIFSLGTAFAARGTGFANAYTSQQSNYTTSFSNGINPDRANYVVAVGVTWNLASPFRIKQQVRSQKLISEGLKEELILTRKELASQLSLSDSKLKNAIADYYETPLQVKAATDAYQQKVVLYEHGLTTLVDVQQAQYALVRAETDRDIAYSNVWQALLLKAAATGDFSIFSNNL